MRKGLTFRVLGLALALMLFGAACAAEGESGGRIEAGARGESESTEDRTMSSDTEDMTEPTVDTPAAMLTRDLTSLLAGHEYHAGIALYTAVQAKGDLEDPTVAAAVQALDDNSVALSETIESVYGPEAGKKFLDLWRAHIGFFVDYTLAKATGDESAAKKAQEDLDGYRADFGALMEGATEGGLTQDAVAKALDVHVKSTITAIDSIVAADGKAFDKLQIAAGHLPGIASAISGAIVEQFPEKF